MRAFKQFAWLLVLAAFTVGCAGLVKTPETQVERLAFLQSSYDSVLQTATLYVNERRFTNEQMDRLSDTFDDIEDGFRIAKAAIRVSDAASFDNNAAAINESLTILRDLLAEVE